MERRETGENRKGPPRHRGSTFCSERPVCQHLQLKARRLVQSATRSDWRFASYRSREGYFEAKIRKNPVFSIKRSGRCTTTVEHQSISTACSVRVQRSAPLLDRSCGAGNAGKLVVRCRRSNLCDEEVLFCFSCFSPLQTTLFPKTRESLVGPSWGRDQSTRVELAETKNWS